MISFIKKYKYVFIGLVYFVLLGWGSSGSTGEAKATVIAFLFTFFLILRWAFVQIRSIIKLKSEKKQTELLHLKSQINPHFFFNTLNNLYGLIEKDPKKAGKLVLKLSDMMRYSIYDGQKDLVTLEEEIDYLNNYIELHKMRYHKKIDVKFDINIEGTEHHLMPLLFIILLENAFKHGVENLPKGAYVNIDLLANNKEIQFMVENNFDEEALAEEQGIGLHNLTRRLELVYPKKHTLSSTSVNDVYRAQLTLRI